MSKKYTLSCFTQHRHLQVNNNTQYNKTQQQYNQYRTSQQYNVYSVCIQKYKICIILHVIKLLICTIVIY